MTLMPHERPHGFGASRVEFKEAEPNARDGQMLADMYMGCQLGVAA